MVSRKFFLSEGQEGELQTFVQEDMLIDGELAMDDRGHFLIQAVCGDDAYVLFDEIGKGCAAMLIKLKNGTPHSRYFSDELGVPNFLVKSRTSVCCI